MNGKNLFHRYGYLLMPDIFQISYRNKNFILSYRYMYCKLILYTCTINLNYRASPGKTMFAGSPGKYLFIYIHIPTNIFKQTFVYRAMKIVKKNWMKT